MAYTDLLALAERVERFDPSGPYAFARDKERELNEAIAAAAGVPATVEVGHEALGNYRKVPARLPAYTASLDAAMSLVPLGVEGIPLSFKAERFYLGNGECYCRASVWCGLGVISSLDTASVAAAPALALTAAALRALASQEVE